MSESRVLRNEIQAEENVKSQVFSLHKMIQYLCIKSVPPPFGVENFELGGVDRHELT